MKKRLALTGILPLIVLLAVPVTVALADCEPGPLGTPGDDTIICSGTTNTPILGDAIAKGEAGDDIISNSGTVYGGLHGDLVLYGIGGDDTITNTGTLTGHITGDIVIVGVGGNDTITSTGTVEGGIHGDVVLLGVGGNDHIDVAGTVKRNIHGDLIVAGLGGDDSVVIRDRANVQGTIYGDRIIGTGQGGTNDALHLDFRQREATPEEYLWFVEAMENADPAGGSVCWMGNCYNWYNFEHLSWQLNYNFGPLPYYFMDIPDYQLPVYGDGSAPHCSFYSAQHGPKWIDPAECEDFDPAAVDLVCLNQYGMWGSDYVSGVGPTADGKLHFTTIQHGICSIFPKS